MDYEEFKVLARDYKKGMIQITPRCMYDCEFCYNDFVPEELKTRFEAHNEYVDPESFSKLIRMVPGKKLILGESANFYDGDIMAHPRWKELIRITRNFHPNGNIFVSTARVLSGDDIRFLAGIIDELTHTFTSFSPEVHQDLTGGEETAREISEMFEALSETGLSARIKIIPVSDYYGWEQIERDVRALRGISNIYSIDIVYPGYTRFTPDKIKARLDFDKDEFLGEVRSLQDKYGKAIGYSNLSLKNNRESKKKELIDKIKIHSYKESKVLLLASEMMYPLVKEVREEFERKDLADLECLPVVNNYFGGNIEVGGLLVLEDFLRKKEEINSVGADVILTTKAPFAYQGGRDLRGNSRKRLDEELDPPVIYI